jgi:hypothetical protein
MVGKNDYHSTSFDFMNGHTYAKMDHQFIQDELAPLILDDIVLARWMCQQKAYGTPDPNPDADPTQA